MAENLTPAKRWALFLRDKDYYTQILQFGLPIAAQQLIFSSLNLVANLMVGQLGETTVAAVNLAGQIFFLFNLMVFGIGSGAAMFTAQLWGKQDLPSIRKVVGIALSLSLAGSLVFLLAAEFFPAAVLGVYTRDPQVIAAGSSYLRIYGFAYVFFGITLTYSLTLRSVGQVRLPVLVSILALLLNTGLSYGLIFGQAGLPRMGADGAALAILISRILECGLLLFFTYRFNLPPAARLSELFSFNREFTRKVLVPILPVTLNEILWSFGITTYQVIYARMGTEQSAAISIASTIGDLATVAFFGLGNATGIMVGHLIGAGSRERAQQVAGRSLGLGLVGGLLIGALVLLFSSMILQQYKVSPQVIEYAKAILIFNCSLLWLRMMNLIQFVGIFRAGGDTRFALILDGFIIWLVGVPLAASGAFIFHLPVAYVYLLTASEEVGKFSLGIWRYFTRRWMHDLAGSVQTIETE